MSLYFYEPFFSFNDISRFFDETLSRRTGSGSGQQLQRTNTNSNSNSNSNSSERSLARGFQPKLDVHESPEQNVVTATLELPGLTKENVSIDVQNGRLVISGEQTISKDVEEKGFVHRERQMGRFSRTLPLPTGTKPSDIQARLENGLLTVTFPKTSEEQAIQKVTIA